MVRIARKLKRLAQWHQGVVGISELEAIGTLAYLYVRAARFRELIDDLIRTPLSEKHRESARLRFGRVVVEVESIAFTVRGLSRQVDRLTYRVRRTRRSPRQRAIKRRNPASLSTSHR